MSVKIIVDSAADFLPEAAAAKGLIVLPMKTRIDGVEYLDGVDVSHIEFYEKLLQARKMPSTSQLTLYDFEQAFQSATADGDEAVVITIAAKLSGTVQNALVAAQSFPERVWVVDSDSASIGERVLVEYAVRLRDADWSAAAIAAELEQAKQRVRMVGLLDTLEYLIRGGRLTGVSALAGSLLRVKSILGLHAGTIEVLEKTRSFRQGVGIMNLNIEKQGGVDAEMPVILGFSGVDDTLMQKYLAASHSLWQEQGVPPVVTIGSAIGSHVGPGMVAAAFFIPADQ